MQPTAEALSLAGDKYLGTPYDTMDCQAFIEKCLADIGIKLDLKGSNAWFRKMTWVGTPEECKARFGSIPKGAFLFIWDNLGGEKKRGYYDGLGDATHIGIFTGRGKGAIHSSYTNGKVCESTFAGRSISGGWNRVGLWNRLSYGEKIDQMLEKTDEGGGSHMVQAMVTAEKGNTVNLRARPSMAAKVIKAVKTGELVDVIEDGQEWSRVRYSSTEGYMMSKFLIAVAGDPPEEAPPEQPQEPGEPGTITLTLDSDLAYDLWVRLGEALGEDTAHG